MKHKIKKYFYSEVIKKLREQSKKSENNKKE